jgi:hypothetical protein
MLTDTDPERHLFARPCEHLLQVWRHHHQTPRIDVLSERFEDRAAFGLVTAPRPTNMLHALFA